MGWQSIPVIDLSEDPSTTCNKLKDAAESVGFFYLRGHGIADDEFAAVFSALKTFFALPMEDKMKIHTSKTGGVRGYIGLFEQGNYGIDAADQRAAEAAATAADEGQAPHEASDDEGVRLGEDGLPLDYKEVFTMGTELSESHPHYHATLFAPNVFPDGLPAWRDVIDCYYRRVWEVALRMYRLIALFLGLPEDHFGPFITEPMNSMNCLHYPPYSGSHPRQLGIGAHTDYECFTLLAQDGVPGLEIMNDDNEWVAVPPNGTDFVVNIGDMLARWSNGRFKSTVHRARNPTAEHRYSIAYFCCCNFETPLTPLVNADHPKYPPVLAGVHMLDRIHRANIATQDGQKAVEAA
ncbi:unnamed protein product [Vitrella brassicaformis CCMP3155]|uniref:Fe2OG dioxygenase domain-containing protein n=1 Tax=Vitrella brassicaformis (strain CCMP3155) TaxID=1169540 RepID=A0A0G4FWY7_VITBC|nr:unnamed protein product [Vitrella brassicaformis CCMP3155]|eukprot:CEM19829.1 unnamed protein product [Vitrella brassicaformis CCMP3155]